MARNQTVLSVGADNELVSLRHAVLESVGLNVFSTTDPYQAYARIQLAIALQVARVFAAPIRLDSQESPRLLA